MKGEVADAKPLPQALWAIEEVGSTGLFRDQKRNTSTGRSPEPPFQAVQDPLSFGQELNDQPLGEF